MARPRTQPDELVEEEATGVEMEGIEVPPDGTEAELHAEPVVYRFRLKDDVEGAVASFMADGQAIELTPDNQEFETKNRSVAVGLRDVSFLEEVSA